MNTSPRNVGCPGYDVIGDVHGDAERLTRLLQKLGYRPVNGVMRHPAGRRAVFVGDLVDRGPKVRETLGLARAMVEAGTAFMVLGNHEFNLLCLHTPDGKGGYLRERSERNLKTCQATTDAFEGRENELRGFLEWFRTLPLYLDLGGCRVVHAEWRPEFIAGVNGKNYLDDQFLRLASTRKTSEHRTIEVLLKGSELRLPGEATYLDFDQTERADVRVCWPLPTHGLTFRALAFGCCDNIPDVPVPAELTKEFTGYGAEEPPVFFGHYFLNDIARAILAPNVACLDHGCGKGGRLVAYRWSGERALSADNLVST